MNTSLICRILTIIWLTATNPYVIEAQNFDAALSLGLNFSQIEGDKLSGYNHIGPKVGFTIDNQLGYKSALSLGLFYEQKGSSSSLNIGAPDLRETLSLHYLSISSEYKLYEWWNEHKATYQVALIPGISVGRLFKVASTHSGFDDNQSNFRPWDIALGIGIQYAFSQNTNVTLRFERSILKLYHKNPQDDYSLQGFLLNLQFSYNL